jgi:hypothetical protein
MVMAKRRRAVIGGILLCGLLLVVSMVDVTAGEDRGLVGVLAGVVLDRYVVGSSGGPISGGGVALNGTLGQPIIGPAGSEASSLGAGYWYHVAGGYWIHLPLVLRNH